MAVNHQSLATYIENIHYGNDFQYRRGPIFDYGITHRPPILRSGRINRILVYPGSFNPPHRGHFELLRHGYMKNGHDLNIIAAIILPLDDESLVKKLHGHKSPLIFTKIERNRLWNGYGRSDWYWTYDRTTDEWFEFQRRITKTIVDDGFDISWTALCGPDYVQVCQVPQIPVWGCNDIIVSDAGRSADFTAGTVKGLTSLTGCGTWVALGLDFQTFQTHAEEAVRWIFSGAFMFSPQFTQQELEKDPDCMKRMVDSLFHEAIEESKDIKICRRREDPRWTIRFIPTKSRMIDISSTQVRELIKLHLPEERLREELQQLVLYPEIMLDVLSRKRQMPEILL